MIIYMISSPDDNNLLTTRQDIVAAAMDLSVKHAGHVEINTWDTDKMPTCRIKLDLDDGEEEAAPAP